ncbi:MAG: hemin uptake protein HemP [Gammaproteobacteria bacterium]|nr:hemin uptake protein HemP [Gammaproteobacteria bacterium]
MPDSSDSRNITVYANKQTAFIASRELLGEQQCLPIEHNSEFYPLRLTRNNKLILTK